MKWAFICMAFSSAELGLEGIRLTASVLYAVVGLLVLRRKVDADSRLAQLGFAAWWVGLAILGLLNIPLALGWDLLAGGLVAWSLYVYAVFAILFAALAGLVYYLIFLYTGKRTAWVPVAAFYGVMLAYMIYLIEWFGPYIGVEDGARALLFAQEHPPVALLMFSMGLSLPPLAAAAAYMALFFRLDGREARYRILLVSLGLGLWFMYSVFGTLFRFITETEETYAGLVVAQVVGLVAALMVLAAYAPPRPVRRWIAQTQGVPT